MTVLRDYNVIKYIDSITGGSQMFLEGILRPYNRCKRYVLSSSVSDYIGYVDEEPFYFLHLVQRERALWQSISQTGLMRFTGILQK